MKVLKGYYYHGKKKLYCCITLHNSVATEELPNFNFLVF